MKKHSDIRKKTIWGYSFNWVHSTENLRIGKIIFASLICFSVTFAFAQTKELDTPELPEWVMDTIYVNPSATKPGNGTYEHPFKTFEDIYQGSRVIPNWSWGGPPYLFGTEGPYGLRNPQNIAILFKGGEFHNIENQVVKFIDGEGNKNYTSSGGYYYVSFSPKGVLKDLPTGVSFNGNQLIIPTSNSGFNFYDDEIFVKARYIPGNQQWKFIYVPGKIFIGSYGQEKPVIKLTRLEIRPGILTFLSDLEIQGRTKDTTYLSEQLLIRGMHDEEYTQWQPYGFRNAVVHVKNVDLTYGYRAVRAFNFGRLVFEDMILENVWHDAFFITSVDTLIFENIHIKDFCKEWRAPSGPHEGYHETADGSKIPGGDGIQLTGGMDQNNNTIWNVRHIEVNNSIIDGSKYGGKFNIISAGGSGSPIVRNTTFLMHPHMSAQHTELVCYNCVFVGPGGMGNIFGSKYYNSLFIGTHEYVKNPLEVDNFPKAGYCLNNGPSEVYNSVFANWHRATQSSNHNANIRNCIFYNIYKAFDSGVRKVDGSGNIHWNSDGSNQLNVSSNYSNPPDGSTHSNRTDVEPLFVDTTLIYTWNTDDNRYYPNGTGFAHHYVEWESWGDWRLITGSPGINEADPNVYDPEATFTANSNPVDNSYIRGYTDFYKVTHDIMGTPRPQGDGYDTGAYEYTGDLGHTLIFQIENENGIVINNASITFNGTTSMPGVYTLFGIEEGTYNFSVAAPGYETYVYNNLLVSNNDMEILVLMTELPKYSISFEVEDVHQNPIDNATITFNNQTNVPGDYTFEGIPAGVYDYDISAPNYQALTAHEVNVNADATIAVVLLANQYQVQLSSNPSQGGSVYGSGNYSHGQNVTVAATHAQGYSFQNWTENGNVVSTSASFSFTVTQDRNLTANFSPYFFSVSLSASPSSGGNVSGAGEFYYGQIANVTATSHQGYTFLNWTENGNVVSANASYSFPVTQDRNLVANFSANAYTISLTSSPASGGNTSGGGNYSHGQNAVILASPAQGYTFLNWTENGNVVSANASYSFPVTQDRNLVASFSANAYTISLTSSPASGGNTSGGGNYSHGQNAVILASPAQGYTFLNWTENGNVVSANASYSFPVTQDRNLVANFSANAYTISLTSSPASGGNTSGGGNYSHGQNAVILASPAQGYTFLNWTENGNVVSANASYSFPVTKNRSLMANFSPNVYTVSLSSNPDSSGTTNGNGVYLHGSVAIVSVSPSEGFVFENWTENGNVVANSAKFSFPVFKNRTLIANLAHMMFVLIYLSDGNGIIEGENIQYVPYNGTGTPVYALPDPGYHFDRWCDQSYSSTRVETHVKDDLIRTAFFRKNVYTLHYLAENNGIIIGNDEQSVEHGSDGSMVEAAPYQGYKFVGWSDGRKQNPRIDLNVLNDLEVTAIFKQLTSLQETKLEEEVRVYPIPTKRHLNIEVRTQEEFEVFLLSNSGRLISYLPKANQGSNQYNVSWLSPGVYYLNLVSANKRKIIKIVKGR